MSKKVKPSLGNPERMSWDDVLTMIAEATNDLDYKQVKGVLRAIFPGVRITVVRGTQDQFNVQLPE